MKGVEIRVGGGTSIMPRVAPTLYEFVELDNGDYLKVTEACLRIFDRQDWLRVNRARARIKVLIDKIGIDEFRDPGRGGAEGRLGRRARLRPRAQAVRARRGGQRARAARRTTPSPTATAPSSSASAPTTSPPQRQAGFSTVHVKVTRGDLTPEQFRGLAEIMRDYSGGYARTTVEQNLVLRWVRDEAVYEVWQRLKALDLGDAGPMKITDVVSCPGTDSCKLGITSSMGLNRAVQERVEEMDIEDELTRKIHIKMSGCPNGCSQHHIANIGFYGASIKVGDKTIPAYIPHIGGTFVGGEVIYGTRLKSRLPSKRVPDAVERWLRYYQAERNGGRGVQRLRRARGAGALHRARQGSGHAGRVQRGEHGLLHRLEPRRASTR